MNYIITKNKKFFEEIGTYNYCNLENMLLPEIIALDTETTGFKPIVEDIFCVQIGTGENNYLIHCYDDNYKVEDIKPYLAGKTLVGQNIGFDLGFLYKYNIYPDKVLDTFLASKILYNGYIGQRHDFGSIFEREMNIIYDKQEQSTINKVKLSTASAIKYCFNDVDRLIELETVLAKKIDEGGYRETYDLHCDYIKALAYMEQCGVPLSQEKWEEKIKLDIQVKKDLTAQIKEYIWDNLPQFRQKQIDMFDVSKKIDVQLTSPKQMIEVFKALNINVLDDNYKESISEDILKKSSHEFIPLWLQFQSANHDVSTFGANILDKVINGRIYSGYNPILDTARISTKRGDVNTLNLPANERTRVCITAKPGFQMIVCDYDGQETRVGADITGDQAMIDSIINKACLHCAFARVLYPELEELSDEEIIKNHKAKRTASKSPRFCFQFGGGGYTLAMDEGIPVEEGMRIEKLYKSLHTGIYQYGEKKIIEAIKLGYIESTMGFKLHLPYFSDFQTLHKTITNFSKTNWTNYSEGKKEFKNLEANKKHIIQNTDSYKFYIDNKGLVSKYFKLKSKYFRLCLNNPTQTTASHQTKMAAAMLFEYIKKQNHLGRAKICIIPHDEFVMEVENSLVDEYKEKLGYFMRTAGDMFIDNPIIKMEADANSADNWYDAK